VEIFKVVVSLATGLAWPVVVLWIALTFRGEIKQVLASRNTRLKAGPFELALEQARVDVEAATQATVLDGEASEQKPAPGPSKPPPTTDGAYIVVDPRLGVLARSDPTGALVQGFKQLETELRSLLIKYSDADPVHVGLLTGIPLATTVHRSRLITDESFDAIQGLAVLRNLAAHGMEQVDSAKALDFLLLLDASLYSLRRGPGGRLHGS
jgi:hypothetical protein